MEFLKINKKAKIIHFIHFDDKPFCMDVYPTDIIYSKQPPGRLCKRCRKIYLKTHTKEELFLELI